MTPSDKIKLAKAAALLKVAVTEAYALIRDTDHAAPIGLREFTLPIMIQAVTLDLVADEWLDLEGCEYIASLLKAPQVTA